MLSRSSEVILGIVCFLLIASAEVKGPSFSEPERAEISLFSMLLLEDEFDLERATFEEHLSTIASKLEKLGVSFEYSIPAHVSDADVKHAFRMKERYIAVLSLICDTYGFHMTFNPGENLISFVETRKSRVDVETRVRLFMMVPAVAREMGFEYPLKKEQFQNRLFELGCLANIEGLDGDVAKLRGTALDVQRFEVMLMASSTRLALSQ